MTLDALACLAVGVLVACGAWLLLDGRLRRVIVGLLLLSHAANLLLLLLGRRPSGRVPIVEEGAGPYADPLPPALILTAIVISMAVAAFALALVRKLHESGVETLDAPRKGEEEEDAE